MATGFVNMIDTSGDTLAGLNDVNAVGIQNGELLKWSTTNQKFERTSGWEDLRFPATIINPMGAPGPATYDPNSLAFSFAANAIESIAIIAQMPHGWKVGSDIHPHIHWHPTTTDVGNVLWRMEYKWTNINEVESGSWTTIDYLEAGDGVTNKYQIAPFAIISGLGKTLSSILKIKISRIGNDGTDTFATAALLDEFDIHYQEDTLGSSEELVK